ncbi:MAG: hypothetical protein V1744_06760, partial [Candidatus Altiarchaeota archaeon]
MGFSSVISALIVATFIILVGSAIFLGHSGYTKAELGLKSYERMSEYGRRTAIAYSDFNCTNTTDTIMNVTLYILNDGSSSIRTDCIDLLIDDGW